MRDTEQPRARSTLLNSGDILQSRYRILHQLGRGGFSRTYLAEDINRFKERCMLKEFAPQLKGTFALEKAQELFAREAGVLYRLQHDQIPQFRQLFRYKHENKEERLFLVQDYVEGQTYHDLLNNRLNEGKKFSEAKISQLLRQVLPILEYIHSMGVIHRDISPDNLILRSADELTVLIDFGCIKEVENKTQLELQSLVGTAIGKTGYAPPEQIERGIVFAHSDLYALAATAVVLLTGKEPKQLIDLNGYRWNWQEEVTLSPKLEWILTTMLSPNPSDRFGSAVEVSQILDSISVETPTQKRIELTKTAVPSVRNKAVSNLFKQKPPSKIYIMPAAISKPVFFGSLATVLLLGGLLCLKLQDLDLVAPAVSNLDNSVRVDSQLQTRFSQGEKILISQTSTPEKQMAVASFVQGDYERAESSLLASLETVANDPEALIYLNNSRIGQEKSYSIAVSIPIGSDVNAAQEILRGVAQAQERVNQAGGIDGIPLKVQIINDDNDPEIAQQIAKTLSQDREILGVVGHYASDVTLATTKIYQADQLVAISPISTSVKLSNLSPYLFRTVPSDYLAGRGLAEYMLENLQQKNVAVFYNSQSNYSESLKSEFDAAVALGGGRVVNTFDLSDANFNAANSFQQAVAEGAEVIMLAANTGTLDKALQVVQVNRQQLTLLGGDDVYTPKTLQIAGEFAEDMVLAIPWHIKSNPDTEFVQDARQLWGGAVNWRTAMAYDAALALITAIDRSPNPTRISIQKTLSDSDFSTAGANSQVSFLPSGDRLSNIQLVKIQSSNNNFGYEFVPID
ncbi:bifunctional serine/threonine-protein kinase/ABC transporter substrate-binding protein [Pleurocapsa sp. PCC 7319]|uniref:bifunctional serine/threonine-protein kinase/ABC transporter substrate-binding protein n=1 Tax=Pleurocapsa sp. PCC 7319 TaxID=118161 RepID=UPI000347C8D2|nr:bifunctional serine/threonine-protein kinase/ABC transporter substrate-binding protein [Pleurocapsa sp. PCC 7319]